MSFGTKLEKQNTQTIDYFCVYHGFGNPFRYINAAKRVVNDVKNSTGKTKRCHSGRLNTEAKLFFTKVETNKAKMLEPKQANVLA